MKSLIQLALLFALSLPSFAAIQAVQGFCTVGGVKVMTSGSASSTTVQASYPRCLVTVYDTGTTNLSTIYNANGSTKANPFTANANASWLLYGTVGVGYDITLSGGTPLAFAAPFTLVDIVPGGGGGGGGSGTPGGPVRSLQYNFPLGTFAGNQYIGLNTDGTNFIGRKTNSTLNTDVYAGGISGAFASGDCTSSGCIAAVPRGSTDTTSLNVYTIPTKTTITDYRTGAQSFSRNPVQTAATNTNNAAFGFQALFDDPSYGTTTSQSTGVVYMRFAEKFKSFSIGNPAGANPSGWAGGYLMLTDGTLESRGISGMFSVSVDNPRVGDFAGYNCQIRGMASITAASDEGQNCGRNTLEEYNTWYQGLVSTTGTGTTMLPTAISSAGPYGSRLNPYTFDGGFMINWTTKASGYYLTGASTLLGGTSAMVSAVAGGTLTPTVARGTSTIDLQVTASAAGLPTANPTTRTATFTNDLGVFPSDGTPRVGCLSGTVAEHVTFTAAVASGGSQVVTLTYRTPHAIPGGPVTLWYGGECGKYITRSLWVSYGRGIPDAIPVMGATDSTHIVYAWNEGGFTQGHAIPIYGATQALQNLSVSGSVISGQVFGATQQFDLMDRAQFVQISGCTNTTFNGIWQNSQGTRDANGYPGGYTWAVPSGGGTLPTGTCALGTISLPPAVVGGFYLACGAEIVAPSSGTGTANYLTELEPNNCTWSSGDQAWSVSGGVYKAAGSSVVLVQRTNAPNGLSIANNIGLEGSGVNAQTLPFYIRLGNPPNFYAGGGGYNTAPAFINLDGVGSSMIRSLYLPVDSSPAIEFGVDPELDFTKTKNILSVSGRSLLSFQPSSATTFMDSNLFRVSGNVKGSFFTGFGYHFFTDTASDCGVNAYADHNDNIGFVSNDHPASLWCKFNAGNFFMPANGSVGFFPLSTLTSPQVPDVQISRVAGGISVDTATIGNGLGTIAAASGTLSGSPICTPGNGSCTIAVVKGRVSLVAGTATVATASASGSANYQLTNCSLAGTAGLLSVGTIVNGTSFVINSANAADTSTICWVIQ